ncbi:MAG: hypothetical protein SGPRY_007681 [Prymnesium sp.]
MKQVFAKNDLGTSVGRIRSCVNALAHAKMRGSGVQLENSPRTVLMRSVLRQDAEVAREMWAMRLTAESVFAALMLTISFQAIIEPPSLDQCEQEFGSLGCDSLYKAYVMSWGLTTGSFLCSALVSLASMQVFLPVGTVHFVMIQAESYLSKSNFFIGKCILSLALTYAGLHEQLTPHRPFISARIS